MTTRITISLPDDMAEEINSQLEYGDSRSEWIRKAIEMRLEAESEGNPNPNPTMMQTAD